MNTEAIEVTLVRICLEMSGIHKNLNSIVAKLNKNIIEAHPSKLTSTVYDAFKRNNTDTLSVDTPVHENLVLLASNRLHKELQTLFNDTELAFLRGLATEGQIVIRTALHSNGEHEIALVLNMPKSPNHPLDGVIPLMTTIAVKRCNSSYAIKRVRVLNPTIDKSQLDATYSLYI